MPRTRSVSGTDRSTTADVRCARRSRTAWPPSGRDASMQRVETCRAHCGRAASTTRVAGRYEPSDEVQAAQLVRLTAPVDRRCRSRRPADRIDIHRRGPRSCVGGSRRRSRAGTCRRVDAPRPGSRPGPRPCTSSLRTFRPRCRGSLIWLHSFPSENVPAPPSPNWTLDSGFSSRDAATSPQVSCVRSRTTLPRSTMIGRSPIWARINAQNRPHGPRADDDGSGRRRVRT